MGAHEARAGVRYAESIAGHLPTNLEMGEAMPVEFAIWRLDGETRKLESSKLPSEAQLEALLTSDISILGLDLLVIGRQVVTAYGKKIDLLAIDRDGAVHVIELKRDKTPREVVAQALDYGSWVKSLTYEQIAATHAQFAEAPLEVAFEERFESPIPEVLNQNHHLVIVASELDASTERIVNYLSADYGVPVNVLFFRYFTDDGRAYLARTWLIAPSDAEAHTQTAAAGGKKEPWNGTDFYVSFGEGDHRSWDDAREYGFVSGGGRKWYWQTLELLQPGARVFVCIPHRGYVGVGEVVAPSVPVRDFVVLLDGSEVSILNTPFKAPNMGEFADATEKSEHLVRVRWTKTVPADKAVWEKGMFANQNTACALRSSFTRDRVLAAFELDQ